MISALLPLLSNAQGKQPPRAARAVLGLLSRLPHGALELHLPDGTQRHCGSGPSSATARVHDWAAFSQVLQGGDIGLAEGYIQGLWDSPDLSGLMRLLLANRAALDELAYGRWWSALLHRLRHALKRNSRRGSARNVQAHYDLGNAFYALWLDASLSYSGACFDGDFSQSLEQAQHTKMRRVLAGAGVTASTRLLEIGCGWGALAEMAALDYGAQVTAITLSAQQRAAAQARIAAAGLQGRCELRLQDYRDLAIAPGSAPYDAIISIEMFEAVGRAYWDGYLRALRRCLKPGGLACIQTITIRDELFERYARSSDFIQHYIFPGGLLPSAAQFEALATRHGFAIVQRQAFGADYAETLRRWRAAFTHAEHALPALGFDAKFIRTWHFYLTYCEAAFDSGQTDVWQFSLRRD